jgi:hypothetical protein
MPAPKSGAVKGRPSDSNQSSSEKKQKTGTR